MRHRHPSRIAVLAAFAACAVSACSVSSEAAGKPAAMQQTDAATVPIPPPATADTSSAAPVDEAARGTPVTTPAVGLGPTAALIDTDGQLAIVESGVIDDTWLKWQAFPSPDRSTAVLTLGPHIQGIGPDRPVTWVNLPDGNQLAEQTMYTDSELTATSLDGTFAGFTTRADEAGKGAIAGAREHSLIQIVARDDGTVFEQQLNGNFVPEAFSRTLTAVGVPRLVFLLEYFPADAPRFYRVRVLSTETGDVSLPLNLRDKSQQIDERMAGFTRSQVVAHDHGLLFTLYRGTIDGTPDGEPYAFVHTLDFADGVWCLDVDPRLDLDEVQGSLAVGGDRLYVGSANGLVGSIPIPSIADPTRSPSMDWVAEFSGPGEDAPVLAADADGVWIAPDDPVSRLVRIDATGERAAPLGLPSAHATAMTFDAAGGLYAVGDDWATFDVIARPDWLEHVAHLVVG